MTESQQISLLDTLCALPKETEWVEFKVNNTDPEDIGEYLSALSNSARLLSKEAGYIVWGIGDETHAIIGTSFEPRKMKVGHPEKKGNQELESWLALILSPRIDFQFHEFSVEGKAVVILEVQPCQSAPICWRGVAYIRVGSYKKPLKDFPPKESALWRIILQTRFEEDIAMSDLTTEDILRLLDFSAYYDLTKEPLPTETVGFVERLVQEKMVSKRLTGGFDITNYGAILFAKRLNDFDRLRRKAVRVIKYDGTSRSVDSTDHTAPEGYAAGFEALITYINSQLPANAHIGEALRVEARMYPKIAIREIVANAIIHQDFSQTGDSPLVEIFTDRVEITNSGKPLIDPLRFVDEPPQSRNETLAAFMRRVNICEELGTGIDKTLAAIELYQLPAPEFRWTENHTKVFLFSYREFRNMSPTDRVWACYWHSCLLHVSNQQMTNATLRKRFSITDANYPLASKVLQDALKDGLVKPYDPDNHSRRHSRYVPFWA